MAAPLTLYCLPCAGASAAMYLRWRRKLPAWLRMQPIELPGRGERLHEAPEKTFDALAGRLCDELAINPSQRYALFGHSMGALLACRVAHCLRARMRPLPVALLVSACAAPSQQDWKRYADKDSDASLIAELRKQDGTPEEVFGNPELLSMTLGLLGADYRICASFRYQKLPPLPLPIHVFGGCADEIHVSKLEAWRLESTAKVSLDWFEGGHFFLRQHEEIFLSTLAQRLAGDAAHLSDVSHAALASA
ncbi:thioesterase II family protein [Nitrosospira sp. NpAV]|uniref:thioesterase II family protein n=1 Tax=Nitrosospira sp. NpAV TaxID=58133 RepID=UPI0005A1505E|nr:alpha/beta fold hydrolase [Nitrosospira sp. NpAV]KIO47869.1 thioesterase [Nitrosospira sp. NpAV]